MNQILELGLFKRRKPDGENLTVRFARLSSRLISLISEIAIESESLNTSEFRSKLERYRSELERVTDSRALESLIEKCLGLCQNYFRQAGGYLLERETEIREVVDVLREAVSSLTGESASFNQRLVDSSMRFKRLDEIEDLREMKRLIAREVNELSRIVAEKKKQDEALYSKMSKRFDQLQQKLKQTKQEVLQDPLTQVGNRRSFDREIKHALLASTGEPIILAMLDLDDFKNINDSLGHQVGDQALVCMAKWLASCIRSGDFLARYGGDEFVIFMIGTSLPQAEIRFLQLLAHIAASSFEYTEGKETRTVRLTVSCGVAESIPGETPEDLVRRADRALYSAKRRGKNCVVAEKAMSYT